MDSAAHSATVDIWKAAGRVLGEDFRELDPVFQAWRDSDLIWLPERGMGYFPVTENPYDDAYFQKYVDYAATPLGRELTRLRVYLVDRWAGSVDLVDVGSGCGQFIQRRNGRNGGKTYGYDINPRSIEWLERFDCYKDPYRERFTAATFWDTIEHIPDVHRILAHIKTWVFCSLPIFSGVRHVMNSKHYKPGEHCFYWTRDGFVGWMKAHGFELREWNHDETKAGREDIQTFAFQRYP